MRYSTAKRQGETREYRVLRDDFLERYPVCRAGLRGYRGVATEVHHMIGREGRRLLLIRYWLPVCAVCHRVITDDSSLALALGLSLPRGLREIDWQEYTLDECVDYGYLWGN